MYAQSEELSTLGLSIVGVLTLMCVLLHYKAAFPKFNTNQDENFEKGLFVFSLNLLAMLAVFKLLRPGYEAWYKATEMAPLVDRAVASVSLVATSIGAMLACWVAMKATAFSAEVASLSRRLQIDVCAYSAGMGAFLFMAPVIDSPSAAYVQPLLGWLWVVLAIYVAIDAEKGQHKVATYASSLLAFAIVYVVGHPARAHLLDHGSALKSMDALEALDFLFAIVFWVVAAVKIAGDVLIHQLYLRIER